MFKSQPITMYAFKRIWWETPYLNAEVEIDGKTYSGRSYLCPDDSVDASLDYIVSKCVASHNDDVQYETIRALVDMLKKKYCG